MALVSMKNLMEHAIKNEYAVGYFETWNLESTLAVIDAAEKTGSPVIIGFNGGFLENEERQIKENIYLYGNMGRAIAKEAKVPVSLMLNEADKVPVLIKGLKAGFNAVMYGNEENTVEEFIEITKYLVKTAHYCDAVVEAEVGELPTANNNTKDLEGGKLTDPEQAAYFVEQTSIDALAVSVGNVHLLEGRKAKLDFDLIKVLRDRINVPLVLHGGTGIDHEDIKEGIKLGLCKINIGTILKRVFINSVNDSIKNLDLNSINPHDIIGKGGGLDMLMKARHAMTEEIIDLMRVFGSENKAK